MAKDTEKLIRQLSLISFLMAERRPVSALEIKQDVEGYSEMNDDAFARRFYADRAELEALGIDAEGREAAGGLLRGRALHAAAGELLPAADRVRRLASWPRCRPRSRCSTAASPTPSRCASRCSSSPGAGPARWARPSSAPSRSPSPASAGGRELSQRLSKVETAISRRKTIEFDYYSIERDEESKRKVDPYHLLYQGGQFYLVGHAHERDDVRVFRLSRIRDKISYATKAEHDFTPPEDFDPWSYAHRADWQLGEPVGTARIWISERIAWLVERDFGRYGDCAKVEAIRAAVAAPAPARPGPGVVFTTEYAQPRQLIAVGARPRRARARPRARRGSSTRPPSALPLIVERHEAEPDFVAEPAAPKRARSRQRPNGERPSAERQARHADPPRALRTAGRARRHPDPVRARRQRGRRIQRGLRAAPDRPSRSCARTSTC